MKAASEDPFLKHISDLLEAHCELIFLIIFDLFKRLAYGSLGVS